MFGVMVRDNFHCKVEQSVGRACSIFLIELSAKEIQSMINRQMSEDHCGSVSDEAACLKCLVFVVPVIL